MTSIQVKNVPSDVHKTLQRRAAAAGQSLQEYLLEQLTEYAERDTVEEALERIGGRTGGSLSMAYSVEALRADRER